MKHKLVFYLFTAAIMTMISGRVSAQEFKVVEEIFKLNEHGEVLINTYKGSIVVEVWDKAEVYVYAKMEADENWNCTAPKEQLENVEIDFTSSSSRLRIKSDYYQTNSFGCNTLALVHYKIKMPRSASIDIEDQKSVIYIKEVEGFIDVDCYKGEITLKDVSGEIELETYKGVAEVDISKLTAECCFDSYKGDIDIKLPGSTEFSLDLDIEKKGDFDCDFDYDIRSSSSSRRGYDFKADVNGGGHYLDISSYKGNIRIIEK